MKAIFRADASVSQGLGHVSRCLNLAKGLLEQGARVSFVSRSQRGDACDLVEGQGIPVIRLPPGPTDTTPLDATKDAQETLSMISAIEGAIDWIVVDHYGCDARWETVLRTCSRHVLAIDDLANRAHDCDILVDQNLGRGKAQAYRSKVPTSCRCLLGPEYALLGTEFRASRAEAKTRRGPVRRILVQYGASDPARETEKALLALASLPDLDVRIDVVIGSSNPWYEPIVKLCKRDSRTTTYAGRQNTADLMLRADLAIGSCGVTSWERCALLLPAIATISAENQREAAEELAKTGAIVLLGAQSDVAPRTITSAISDLCTQPSALAAMSRKAGDVTDAKGVERLVQAIKRIDANTSLHQ